MKSLCYRCGQNLWDRRTAARLLGLLLLGCLGCGQLIPHRLRPAQGLPHLQSERAGAASVGPMQPPGSGEALANLSPYATETQPIPLTLPAPETVSPAEAPSTAVQRTAFVEPGPLGQQPESLEPPQPQTWPDRLPTPQEAAGQSGKQIQTLPPNLVAPAVPPIKQLPINMDTVLRLTQGQNVQVNLAREQLNEAFANQELAQKSWLPDLFIGPSWYRHDGGIQDQTGQFIHSDFGSLFAGPELNGVMDVREVVFRRVDAERRMWQQKGEVSRQTSERLLEATQNYIDMLTAKTAEVVSLQVEGKLQELMEETEKLVKVDPGTRVELERIKAELLAQQRVTRLACESYQSAQAKMLYLLGLDPCACLVVMDRRLAPVQLVDPHVCTEQLVAAAMTNGPGIREMEGLLGLIERSQAKAQGPGKFLPVFQMRVAEGGFGAGPGASMRWDNRFDLALQARWNLTHACTARERQRIFDSQRQQAHLNYHDLRGRLAMGVQAAVADSCGSADEIRLARKQIEYAREVHRLSEYRYKNQLRGNSPTEVLMALRSLGGAQLDYLNAIRDFDKAQLRLFILTGKAPCPPQ